VPPAALQQPRTSEPSRPWLADEALRHHLAGRLNKATALYLKALALWPDDPDTLHRLGVLRHQQGRSHEAVELVARAVAIKPDVPGGLSNLGIALAALGKLDKAVDALRRAIAITPTDAAAHNNLTHTLHNLGRLAEAEASCRDALRLSPNFPEAHFNLGTTLRSLGRPAEAEASYRQAARLRLHYPEAHHGLGTTLRDLGRLADAEASYREALRLRPRYPEAHHNLGGTLHDLGHLAQAEASYRAALRLRPDFPEAHNNLGTTLHDLGRLAEAEASCREALRLRPDFPEAHNNLGKTLHDLGRLAEAEASCREALRLRPDFPEAHNNLGNTLQETARLAEAEAHYRRALVLKPELAQAHGNLGNTLHDQGKLADAVAHFEKAIELAPRSGRHYRLLLNVRRAVAGDRYLTDMENLAQAMPSLPIGDQTELHFALGKAYTDLGQYERSLRHLLAGNALKRRELVYDEAATLDLFARIRATFTFDLMQARRGHGEPSAAPIFIVGMPRSGTTLIEQILASHPNIFGAGELEELSKAAASLTARNHAAASFPEGVPALSDENLRQLGTSYLAAVGPAAPQALRIVDKMPANFLFVGLIHLALPNARIIHVRRDPIDTCLSCFTLLFQAGQAYSYDLAELGRYYRAYATLMHHWHCVLPPGVMLDVQYEDVVADVEPQARRIVAHCGLEWDDKCLAFHRTQRPIRTPSAAQVRQPLYRTSVGRWRPYGNLLQPLIAELAPANAPDVGATATRAFV
jgi:tetratricopeptide (TPR) repeat protein